ASPCFSDILHIVSISLEEATFATPTSTPSYPAILTFKRNSSHVITSLPQRGQKKAILFILTYIRFYSQCFRAKVRPVHIHGSLVVVRIGTIYHHNVPKIFRCFQFSILIPGQHGFCTHIMIDQRHTKKVYST